LENGGNRWVLPVRIRGSSAIKDKILARVGSRQKLVEYTKAVSTVGMCHVVSEFTKRIVLRADVRIERGASRVRLCIEPVTIVVGASSMITSENIIWVSNPETGRGLIGIQKAPRLLSPNGQVSFKIVLCFSSIFNEEIVTLNIESYVFNNSQVVHTMNSACSVVRLLNCITLDVRVVDNTN